jgi:hypothetical protein
MHTKPKFTTSRPFCTNADATDDEISVDGILKLMEELKLAEDDIRLLLLAWKCRCKKQGTITRDEWKAGMKALRYVPHDALPPNAIELYMMLFDCQPLMCLL